MAQITKEERQVELLHELDKCKAPHEERNLLRELEILGMNTRRLIHEKQIIETLGNIHVWLAEHQQINPATADQCTKDRMLSISYKIENGANVSPELEEDIFDCEGYLRKFLFTRNKYYYAA